MENYYERLEVSEKASQEVIEKAYKVLVKKYHPDLHDQKDREKAEEKMKKINEAYDVLIDQERRMQYDKQLKEIREQTNKKIENNINNTTQSKNEQYRQEHNRQKQYYENQEEYRKQMQEETYKRKIENQKYEQEYRKKMEEQINKEYENAYYNYLKTLGYKIKEKWTWKKFLSLLQVIGIMAIIITILWFFPPTNKLIVEFYESNPILKGAFDLIGKLLESVWISINSLFTNPPTL